MVASLGNRPRYHRPQAGSKWPCAKAKSAFPRGSHERASSGIQSGTASCARHLDQFCRSPPGQIKAIFGPDRRGNPGRRGRRCRPDSHEAGSPAKRSRARAEVEVTPSRAKLIISTLVAEPPAIAKWDPPPGSNVLRYRHLLPSKKSLPEREGPSIARLQECTSKR